MKSDLDIRVRNSKFNFRLSTWTFVLAAIVILSAFSTPAFAQGCSMCYNTAAAAKAAAIQALRSGILILLLPTLLLLGGISFLALRSRERSFDDLVLDHQLNEWLDGISPEDAGALPAGEPARDARAASRAV